MDTREVSLINRESPNQVDWLVIFLVLDVHELKVEIEELKNKMKQIRLKDSVKIIFLKDTVQRIRGLNPLNYKFETYEFSYDASIKETIYCRINIPGLDYHHPSSYGDAIIILKHLFLAKNSVLVIWSHGNGIAINNKGRRQGNKSIKNDVKEINEDYDCKKIDYLFVSEIANILQDRLPRQFDMIIVNSCNLQSIDACYILKNITRFYISPETGVMSDGYDFISFFLTILKVNPDKVSYKEIISDLIEGYWKRNPLFAEHEAITALDLMFISAAWCKNFTKLVDYLMKNYKITFPIISDITNNQLNQLDSDSYFFDAVSLLRLFNKSINDPNFDVLFQNFKNGVMNNRVYHKIGKVILEEERQSPQQYGITSFFVYLYDPSAGVQKSTVFECQYWKKSFPSAFVRDFEWSKLVVQYTRWIEARN